MSITNIDKQFKLRWQNWNTPWSSNTNLTWAQLNGEALTNAAKVVSYETWDTNPNTWDSETRTWDECASIMDNTSKPSTSITNQAKP
jgi:hypothetical protein